MRRSIIAGNWKMNTLIDETVDLASSLVKKLESSQRVEVVLAPPFTGLAALRELLADTGIALAGQNIWFEEKGAYTGEVSAAMLKDAGCQFVILGHSERRGYFGEDDVLINKKIKAALTHGLSVIFCVGETLEQRQKEETWKIIEGQLKNGLKDFDETALKDLVIAYEPVWAIGTGKTATPEQAQEVHAFIREFVKKNIGAQIAESLRIQYGGSVTPENSKSLLAQKDIDGALVGSASLKADSFYAIINSAK